MVEIPLPSRNYQWLSSNTTLGTIENNGFFKSYEYIGRTDVTTTDTS